LRRCAYGIIYVIQAILDNLPIQLVVLIRQVFKQHTHFIPALLCFDIAVGVVGKAISVEVCLCLAHLPAVEFSRIARGGDVGCRMPHSINQPVELVVAIGHAQHAGPVCDSRGWGCIVGIHAAFKISIAMISLTLTYTEPMIAVFAKLLRL
jgi:hypothetical protein